MSLKEMPGFGKSGTSTMYCFSSRSSMATLLRARAASIAAGPRIGSAAGTPRGPGPPAGYDRGTMGDFAGVAAVLVGLVVLVAVLVLPVIALLQAARAR